MHGYVGGTAHYSARASATPSSRDISSGLIRPATLRAYAAGSILPLHASSAEFRADGDASWGDWFYLTKRMAEADQVHGLRLVTRIHGSISKTGTSGYPENSNRGFGGLNLGLGRYSSAGGLGLSYNSNTITRPGTYGQRLEVSTKPGEEIFSVEVDAEMRLNVLATGAGNFNDNPAVIADLSNTSTLEGLQFLDQLGNVLDLPPGAVEITSGSGAPYRILGSDYGRGDYDFDSDVDGTDFLLWQQQLGSMTERFADGSGNGTVDAADLMLWQDAFGRTVLTGASIAVPEPPSTVMLVMTVVLTAGIADTRVLGKSKRPLNRPGAGHSTLASGRVVWPGDVSTHNATDGT